MAMDCCDPETVTCQRTTAQQTHTHTGDNHAQHIRLVKDHMDFIKFILYLPTDRSSSI